MRKVFACSLFFALAAVCSADTLTFKDGTVKKVRIYKMTKEYVSYLFEGKLEVVARDKLKDDTGIKIDGPPATEKDIVEAMKLYREEMKKKVLEEEKKCGIKTTPTTEVKSITESTTPIKGVTVIDKTKSDTKATEIRIDPFPDYPAVPGGSENKEPAKGK